MTPLLPADFVQPEPANKFCAIILTLPLRIEKAKMLLKDSHLKISELAKKVGYEEQRYFSQVFKKRTGITPKEFRNICWYSEQK